MDRKRIGNDRKRTNERFFAYLSRPSKDDVVKEGERSAAPSPNSALLSCVVTEVWRRDRNWE